LDAGPTAAFIFDGGNDMYDVGNFLNTDLAIQIPYTDGVILPSDVEFGPGSEYFTVKYDGVFIMVATNISIDTFEITGNNGADGLGSVDGAVLSTTVNGQLYTIFTKRVYGTSDSTINHIIIVPGNGTGINHTFSANTDNDLHTVTGLSSVKELYYVLVSSYPSGYLTDTDIINVANAFLTNVPNAPVFSGWSDYSSYPGPFFSVSGFSWLSGFSGFLGFSGWSSGTEFVSGFSFVSNYSSYSEVSGYVPATSILEALSQISQQLQNIRDDFVLTTSGVVTVKDSAVPDADGRISFPQSWSVTTLQDRLPDDADTNESPLPSIDSLALADVSGMPTEGYITYPRSMRQSAEIQIWSFLGRPQPLAK